MEAAEKRDAAVSFDSTKTSESSETETIREREKTIEELYRRMESATLHDHKDSPKEGEYEKDNIAAENMETEKKAKEIERRPGRKKEKRQGARKNAEKKYKNAGAFISGESVHFLTCAICRATFESRNKLFVHLREHHAFKK
eukprot:jgi/Antlo1/2335/1957